MTYQLGVDLGTTFTTAAVARDDRVEITALGTRSGLMPSVVYVGTDSHVLTGERAWRRRLTEPNRVAREVKGRVGDTVPVILGGVPFSPERLMAMLLRGALDAVATTEGGSAERIVLAHPAVWGGYRRDVLAGAVRSAGIEVTTITEPEAAATYYASDHPVEPGQILAAYSLGGGQFEATVLRKTQTGFEILGRPEGIDRVGDIDNAIFNYVARQVGGPFDVDQTDAMTATSLAQLRDECTAAKEALSYEIEVSIPVLLPNVQTVVRLSRADFEAMVRPLLEETFAALGRVLRSAALAPTDLSAVLLMGGSTRIPLVRTLLASVLGPSVTILEHMGHAVALGAALVAAGRGDSNVGAHRSGSVGAGVMMPSRPQLPLDDDVQFTVYRPSQVQPDLWYALLAFAHRTTLIENVDGGVVDPVEVVERQARVLLDDERVSFHPARIDADFGLARGSELRFQPWLEQGEVNPASTVVHWHEPVHRAEFRIRLPASADGRIVRGGVRIFVGIMIVGEVPFRLQVTSTPPAMLRPEARTAARPYRQIFASYSRRDIAVVEAVARYVSVTGDRYLIDVQDLRSGERWERKLEELIERADVFQLFWSQNSMRSPFVRQEWEYALTLGRDEFVRPVYWDDKLPEDETVGLPPNALRALHFSKLTVDVPWPPPPPTHVQSPSESPPAPTRSDLDEVADSLERDDLPLSDQQQLVGVLKRLNEEDESGSAVVLLRRLRRRQDVYASVAEQIDIELSKYEPLMPGAAAPTEPSTPWPPSPPPPMEHPTAPTGPHPPPPSGRPPVWYQDRDQSGAGYTGQPAAPPSGFGFPYGSGPAPSSRRVPVWIAIVVVVVILTVLIALLR